MWRSNEQASLELFINQLPEGDRDVSLQELIDIDLFFRAQRTLLRQPEAAQRYLELWPKLDANWLTDRVLHHLHGDAARLESTTDSSQFSLTQVGDYVIDGPLGTGGMGHIYRARHRLMGRLVALKVLKENQWQDDSSRRRFEREVQLLARLSHPNIVTAFDARQENGRLVLVTELVEGEDLAKRVKRLGPLEPLQAMQFVRQAAGGLKYAHEQNIIHRDIKPSNLLLSSNQTIKVLDLGLARWSEPPANSQPAAGTLTSAEQVVGTPQYMAPEQARTPLLADHRADIYSLGCTLYFLLTGTPPYSGQSSIEAIVAHWELPTPRLPTRLNGNIISDGLAELVQSMMAKQLENRIQSMEQVLERLDAIMIGAERNSDESSLTETDCTKTAWPETEWPEKDRTEETPNSIDTSDENLVTFDETLVARSKITQTGEVENPRLSGNPTRPVIPSIRQWTWQRWSLAGGAIALVILLASIFVDRGDDLLPARLPQATLSTGVVFDGQADYISVDGFAPRVDRPVRIEVAAIARAQNNAANLVSWTGNPSIFIFTSQGSWGVAYQADGQPQLIASQPSIRYGERQMVCGEWTGEELRLYVDGSEVETEELTYPMSPTTHGLYLGGVPDGILPEDQGPRFFRGTIYSVRISEPDGSPPEKDWFALTKATEKTLYIFPTPLAP